MTDPPTPPALLALGETLSLRPSGDPDDAGFASKLVLDACASVHLYTADRGAELTRLEANSKQYARRALEWLYQQRNHPWERKLDDQAQIWVGKPERQSPSAEEFQPPHDYWGDGVWRPPKGGFWTTSEVLTAPSPWLAELAPDGEAQVWRLTGGTPRVYEIHCAQDWRDLVVAYPKLVEASTLHLTPELSLPSPLYLTDFEKMRCEWDALRISMSGKLRGYFLPMPVIDGFTILHGTNGAEETLWLRWVFGSATKLDSCAGTTSG